MFPKQSCDIISFLFPIWALNMLIFSIWVVLNKQLGDIDLIFMYNTWTFACCLLVLKKMLIWGSYEYLIFQVVHKRCNYSENLWQPAKNCIVKWSSRGVFAGHLIERKGQPSRRGGLLANSTLHFPDMRFVFGRILVWFSVVNSTNVRL